MTESEKNDCRKLVAAGYYVPQKGRPWCFVIIPGRAAQARKRQATKQGKTLRVPASWA